MKKITFTIKLICILNLSFCSMAFASDASNQVIFETNNKKTICSSKGKERIIELVYPNKTALPCEVQYTTSGNTRVMWKAKEDRGYCEERADYFIGIQQDKGWSCQLAPSTLAVASNDGE